MQGCVWNIKVRQKCFEILFARFNLLNFYDMSICVLLELIAIINKIRPK